MKNTTKITLWGRTIEIDKELYETAMSRLKIYDIEELEYETAVSFNPKRGTDLKKMIKNHSDKELTTKAENALKHRLELLND